MASLFRRKPSRKITPLFREIFAEVASQRPDDPIMVAISLAAEESGMTEFDAEAIAQRLLEISQKVETRSTAHSPATPAKKSSGFGSQYSKWLSELTTEKLCLWLADYDMAKARSLYCDTDIDDLEIMVALKTGHEWQLIRAQFEACVIGFGGKIEGQTDTTVHEVDMSNTESVNDMIAQMKALGF